MGEWSRVKWSEAAQILDALGEDAAAGRGMGVRQYYEQLKASGQLSEAAQYLAQALPRWETVAWAARTIRDLSTDPGGTTEASALKATLLWVQDPTEPRRRAAHLAAQAASATSAHTLAALAAFHSGGSVGPEDCEPVIPPRSAAGLFAAGAIRVAAAHQSDPSLALLQALSEGEKLAVGKERGA